MISVYSEKQSSSLSIRYIFPKYSNCIKTKSNCISTYSIIYFMNKFLIFSQQEFNAIRMSIHSSRMYWLISLEITTYEILDCKNACEVAQIKSILPFDKTNSFVEIIYIHRYFSLFNYWFPNAISMFHIIQTQFRHFTSIIC